MSLGIITYLAEDKSHGYLYSLEDIDKKDVYNVIKKNNKDASLKFDLKGEDLGLNKFQIVQYTETGKNKKTGKSFIKIVSTYFRAVVEPENDRFRVIILELDKQINILEATEKEFAATETGVVMFQIQVNIGRLSADFIFNKILTKLEGKGNARFWINKFDLLSSTYSLQYASTFDYIFESIIRFLKIQLQESFDINKLISNALVNIKNNCKGEGYKSLIWFIDYWKENYPELFQYSEINKILCPDIKVRIEFWLEGIYSFKDLFPDNLSLTDEVIEYALNKDEVWQRRFLQELKSVEVPFLQIIEFQFKSLPSAKLGIENYYKNIFNLIKQIVSDSGFYVLDIEYDGHKVKEMAFSNNIEIENATSQNEIDKLLLILKEKLSKSESFLVGHNIEKFDLPILKQIIQLPEGIFVIDTLTIETVLSPNNKSFALDTKHNAKDDVMHTLDLLTNQVIRLIHLEENRLRKLSGFMNVDFLNFIYSIKKYVSESSAEMISYFEIERNKYYVNKENKNIKTKEFQDFLSEKVSNPAFIIAPKDFYPLLSELSNILFCDDNSLYSKIILKDKVECLPDGSLEKFLLEAFIQRCEEDNKAPLYVNLPGRIKILINEIAAIDFITESVTLTAKSKYHICVPPDQIIDILPQIKESNREVILLESNLISVTEKKLMKTLEYTVFRQRLNTDSFWMYFTGGQSRVEITREDLKKLGVENIGDHFEFFWIEKNTLDIFQIWGNFDFLKLLSKELNDNKVLEFTFNRNELENKNCKYVIPKSNSGKFSITRYNPETRYRDRYWTFQINLIKEIIFKTDKPTVLIINQQKEKQNLYDYFTFLRYFVPDLNAALIRQVDLLINYPSARKILIITKDQIHEIIQSVDLNGFNFILDSFDLEEKWFISKGTGFLKRAEKDENGLKFRNADAYNAANKEDNDNTNQNSSSQDIFMLLKIQKPIIDYYRWLFHSADKDSTVWLTDSRLGDFSGLEEEWKAKKDFVTVWDNDESYKRDYLDTKSYFRSPVPNEELQLSTVDELERAKESLRQLFLFDETINKAHNWYDYQNSYLDVILPASKDILVTLPTGGGKSLLFQAPALYRSSMTGRLTIVVTPLKALMEDQVETLKNKYKFYGSVDYINQDRKDIQYIYRRIVGGEILLLYITPERYRSRAFRKVLEMRLENDGGLEYAVYDEAHCVSQWGLDFRPDYLNSANVNKELKLKSDFKFPLLFFSATVSKQISNDFKDKFGNDINTIDNQQLAYNPVREHIALSFETSDDKEMKLSQIANALFKGDFNPEKSRCLIFVRRRNDAEENIQDLTLKLNNAFADKGINFTDRVAYFHAGMNAEERQDVYNAYKSGDICILLATKAFGMGMDIPNIHFVYHFGPSGTLEDYLQEVGRAGRNADKLNDAGFSNSNPIQTICFFEKDDFKKIKTLLHNGRLTWTNLVSVFNTVTAYYAKFRSFESQNDQPIVLPFNILSQTSAFDNIQDKDQLLRLSLYWLEKLDRIRLGFYAPAQLVFSQYAKPSEGMIESLEQRKLLTEIEKVWNEKDETTEAISIELSRLLAVIGSSNSSDLLKLIYKCQKKKIFRYDNELIIYPTNKKMDELKYFNDNNWKEPNYLTLEAVYQTSFDLMGMTIEKQQKQFESSVLQEQKRLIVGNYFNEDALPWCVKSDSNGNTYVDTKRIQKEQKDFEINKIKFAFTLADFIPKVRHQTLITHENGQKQRIVQVIYNGCKQKEDWKKFLREFRADLILLLKYVSKTFISKGLKRYNISEFVLQLKLEEKDAEYIQNLLAFANWLGYLHYEGSFLPMGVELNVLSEKEIRHEENNSIDKQIHQEFEATQKLRELRLIALECLSDFDKKFDRDVAKLKKDKFITDYFTCKNEDEIIALIIKNVGENHPLINQYRDEALLKAVYGDLIDKDRKIRDGKGLSQEQLKVYEQSIKSNVQVIAGPGSGKTHTLTLRVARLIHDEKIQPENILVLAYNRAVVVELKERLTKLFSALGYANIIGRLKVFTFSGLCKYCLRDSIKDVAVNKWEEEFNRIYESQKGLVEIALGTINYVFVDEFQDITETRLNLLTKIAQPDNKNSHITVIGDPNQSIYGFERVNEGGSRSPKPYYELFNKKYKPVELQLNQNYRSYPEILKIAEKVIAKNDEKFGVGTLAPVRQTDADNYCEVIDLEKDKMDWLSKLKLVLDESHPESINEKYQQIAIMFRSNREIYRAYNKIQSSDISNIRLRIQGETEQFTKIREVSWMLDHFVNDLNKKIPKDFIAEYRQRKIAATHRFPGWDKYYFDFVECLLLDFYSQMEENATNNDLVEFINELSQKDDGQLSKIYYKHYKDVNPNERITEVVLTTMHKVKGLEFDAVIIPPSFTDLPMIEDKKMPLTAALLKEEIEEERRLMFVALTRARYRLVFFLWKREKAMLAGNRFSMPEADKKKIGIPIQPGFDKLYIGWGATESGDMVFKFIQENLKVGDPVMLIKPNIFWLIESGGNRVGCLSKDASNLITSQMGGVKKMKGFVCSNIYKWTYQETVEYDRTHFDKDGKNTTYANSWSEGAKLRKYIYLIEFSGYGNPVTE